MSKKRELPIFNGKLLSDLDANGHKIIGVDIEFSPKKIKEAIAPELEKKADKTEVTEAITAVNTSLANKADADDVWLRGNDATGETNYAQSIKVNEIAALDDECGIMFGSPIVSNTVNYGGDGGESEPAFAVIEGNMIQALSHDGDSNSDLIIRGRDFYFQGNSYGDPEAPPPGLYTEGDVFCEGEIFTSGLTFRTNDGLGGSLIWEDYNQMLHNTSACSVEDTDWGEGPAGREFRINTYSVDEWSGEQYPHVYTFDCYGDFTVPNAIHANCLYVYDYIQLYASNYGDMGNYESTQTDISPTSFSMNTSSDSWPERRTDEAIMTPLGFTVYSSVNNDESLERRSTSVNLNRDGLFIDGGYDAYDGVDAISLTIDNGLSLASYGDMLFLIAGGLTQVRPTGSDLSLNADEGLRLYSDGSIINLQAGTGLTSEGCDGSYTYFGVSGVGHYTYDENSNRVGADLDSSDFAALREMIDEYKASKGA